jgi:hypothetical protein
MAALGHFTMSAFDQSGLIRMSARQECRVQRIVRPHRPTMASSIINSMPPSQFQDMLYVRCLRDCKTGGLQTADTELDTIN